MRAIWLALPVLGLMAFAPAHAQLNPFGDASKTKLSNEDYEVLGEAVDRLLSNPDLKPGTRETWTNPETKSTGSVTVKNQFHRKGFSCVGVAYQSMARGRPPNRTGALNWCKTPDGWKIL